MTEYSYKVAGLRFIVAAPENFDIEALLPSFSPFRVEGEDGRFDTSTSSVSRKISESDDAVPVVRPIEEAACLFRFTLRLEPLMVPENAEKVEEDENDMGRTRLSKAPDGSYILELSYGGSGVGQMCGSDSGIFMSNASFSEVNAFACPSSPYLGLVLSSMLRIAFAQAVILRDGISLHASAVVAEGRAYLFLGRSGTGKSTHARMWLRTIPGSHLLNDDNPAVRVIGGEVIAFGTPWSGKTPCYRNESYPVGGVARLVQWDSDIFMKKEDDAAFVALLPSCSVVHSDADLQSRLCDTVAKIVELIPVGELKCLPDREAALMCYNNFKSLIK